MSTVRKLSADKGAIGIVASSEANQARHHIINLLHVWRQGNAHCVQFTTPKETRILFLENSGALEIIKGILLNFPVMRMSEDKELISILKTCIKYAEMEETDHGEEK